MTAYLNHGERKRDVAVYLPDLLFFTEYFTKVSIDMTEATTKSDVQIILGLKEGKGFEQVLQPTLLVGTLNGHSLETDRIESCPTPQYATNLVWETNKVVLRRMRSEQASLKLECFAFKENEGRERIGYVLLNIRSAQVLSKYGDLSPKASWYKLLGLRSDLKIQKPELLLALRVEDRKDTNLAPAAERCPEIESHRNPSGDFGKPSLKNIPGEVRCTTECKNINKQSVECFKHQMDKVTCSRSCCDAMFSVNKNHVKGVGSYHCYCLRISLVAVTLVSETLCGREIEFRFYHPRTEVISTAYATMPVLSNEKVKLQDIVCQFHLISAPDEIKQLLQSFPLKISIYDTNRDDELSLLVLDVKPLFHQEKSECQYKLSLLDTDRNKIADIDIILKLEDRGPHCILKKETIDKNLGPPILDDSLAYKIVDELETWKERQKEMFKDVLKKKEDRHLNMLSEEWRMQKENLELKLAYSVEQCKTLANSLNSATEDLRKRRLKSLENETRLIKANEDLQCRYKNKLQELQDTLHATRNDLTTKVAKLEEKKVALEAQVEILSYENENLKSSISKQMDELKIYQKGSLTQDQTASLLQEVKILEEKLDNAQKGKEFFREQWGKAVRELHRMKVDYQETMQVQIKNSREELMSADLAEILSADRKALNNDQMLLNELQKEIDVIKPKQSFAPKEAYNQIFTTAEDVCYNVPCKSNKTVYDKSKEYSERLQALRGEHESLLKTGNYTDDDVVIKKLDAEIRLLMSR
ncbi:PREDICTED: centrosomal protein of 120 kDa-like isoform X5 [Vollenhovia emeryi]|uniref:centrosomal protein of 120 kDa-like isoform X5 n=1 Tax=Vollenhovia emeryi TaxID=411798 RepID=UPI0005F3BDD4|nr:PREDICTED: centrosomal protein of 120 kDa-like isoform X5 [Vollenhovia emeryi]